ncbi:MAG: HAD family hydrolase [Erysipelotrichaceae bacterium]|nr:HAD family hydrolase [Erysipelotrichaceae bacterium]MDD4642366.1 HAD family hydrolase [Erysipelotrichaceae bacterium]
MIEKKIKLIVCDIDGTLVKNDRTLSSLTKEVIEEIYRKGIYFGIASGRSVDQQLYYQAKNWGFDRNFELLIGMNGSQMWDGINEKRYDYYKLKREWLKEIVEMMEPFDLNPFLYANGKMLSKRLDRKTKASSIRNKTKVKIAKDLSELYAEENEKIMFRIDEDRIDEILDYVNANPSPNYKAFKTQTTMLEFTDRRVSKSVALKEFCINNDINLAQVMSFGDMSNDNDLLEVSGVGVCMSNGSEDTKAIADIITDKSNEEDGFAHFIINNIL